MPFTRLHRDPPAKFAVPMYVLIKRHRLGWYIQERDGAAMNRIDTINEIVGDPADVAMVIELEADANGEGGRWRDATSDLAKDIADRAGDDGHPISPDLHTFISDFAGLDAAHGLHVFDPTFAAA